MAQNEELPNIGEAGSMTAPQLLEALNAKGFVVSVFQGSFSAGGIVDPKCPTYLWHGSAYSRDRHIEWSSLRHQISYEEMRTRDCYSFQLVAHHHNSLEECLEKLWQEYLSPTLPPRATKTSVNPAFLRHKKKASQPITDDDLLA